MRAALLCIALLVPAAPPAGAQQIDVREDVLPNGLKILTVPRKGVPRVFCSFFFRAGSVNERPGLTGVSHMLEHMLFKGTRVLGTTDAAKDAEFIRKIDDAQREARALEIRRRALARRGEAPPEADERRRKELLAEAERLVGEERKLIIKDDLWNRYMSNGGTGLNASTGQESTQYFVELPANKLELFFWIEADRMANAVLREFYSERDVVEEERRMRTDSTPTGRIRESWNALYWDAHPYAWPVIGWMSDIDFLSRENAEAYWRTYYAPNNAVAVFVGDFDRERVLALAKAYFGPLPRGAAEPAPVVTEEPEQVGERRMTAEAAAPDSLEIRWRGVGNFHPDDAPLTVLGEVLSGRSGRLYRELVDKQKLALSASAGAYGGRYGGSFVVEARPREGIPLDRLEAAVFPVVDALKAEPPTERELRRVKNQYLKSTYDGLGTNREIAFFLGRYDINETWRDYDRALREVDAVKGGDVVRVANSYLVLERRNVLHILRKQKKSGVDAPKKEGEGVK